MIWPGSVGCAASRRECTSPPRNLRRDALRSDLCEAAFWYGLRRYTVGNAGRSVRAGDLQAAMQASAGQSLQALFDAWVY